MSNNNEDYQTSMRVYRSTVDRLNEYSSDAFGTEQVPNDAVLNHLIDQVE